MRTIDLPSAECIAKCCTIVKAAKPTAKRPKHIEYMRQLRKRFKEQGLTSEGKVPQNKIHPELKGLKNNPEYFKKYHRMKHPNARPYKRIQNAK